MKANESYKREYDYDGIEPPHAPPNTLKGLRATIKSMFEAMFYHGFLIGELQLCSNYAMFWLNRGISPYIFKTFMNFYSAFFILCKKFGFL